MMTAKTNPPHNSKNRIKRIVACVPSSSPSADKSVGYQQKKTVKIASNDSWPLSWRGSQYPGFVFNEERYDED